MGIVLGLTAAFFWGTADFLARYATRQVGSYRALFFMQIIGFAALSLYLVGSGDLVRLVASTTWQPWVFAIGAALLNTVASLALYRAFEVGVLAVVSPIAASYAALTVLLAVLSGEQFSQTHSFGIVAALVGVVLASTPYTPGTGLLHTRRIPPGIGWALLACIAFGVAFWLLGFAVTPQLGGVVPIWIIRLTTLVMLPLLALPLRQHLELPPGRNWWLICAVGVLDTVASVANTLGLHADPSQIGVITVLTSLFSAVTVVLAWLFLRERLQRSQWFGIGVIFVGIVLVNI